MWYCGKNRVWSGCCLHTIMCLTHACRIPPSSTAVLLLKKRGEKNTPTSPGKKQTVPNLITVDIWWVLITMVRVGVSLDLCFWGFYKEENLSRATDSAGNKTNRAKFAEMPSGGERGVRGPVIWLLWWKWKHCNELDKSDAWVVSMPFISWFSPWYISNH